MDFEILVFRNEHELQLFVNTSDPLLTPGLSRRILSSTVLLITKEETEAPENWGQYRSAGWQTICGDWVPCWHQTIGLHDDRRSRLNENQVPYVEVFRGEDLVIVHPESQSDIYRA
jgi:hypothetical protein